MTKLPACSIGPVLSAASNNSRAWRVKVAVCQGFARMFLWHYQSGKSTGDCRHGHCALKLHVHLGGRVTTACMCRVPGQIVRCLAMNLFPSVPMNKLWTQIICQRVGLCGSCLAFQRIVRGHKLMTGTCIHPPRHMEGMSLAVVMECGCY